MFKKLTMAALAMAAVSAMAQDSMSTTSTWSNDRMSSSNREMIDDSMAVSDKRMAVINRARQVLSGGDAYEFTSLLDRAPTSVDLAIIEGLFDAHRSAVLINEQMLMQRYPTYTSMYTTSSTDSMGNTTTTTTTTTTNTWAMDDNQWRPMRMVMQSEAKPKDIDYLHAISILTSDLNDTQAGVLSNWWATRASERQKDVLVKLLESSAAYADRTYYPSVYTRRTWTMSNP
jgi:molybdopterin-guanine dinucleotide biosynthesis protein